MSYVSASQFVSPQLIPPEGLIEGEYPDSQTLSPSIVLDKYFGEERQRLFQGVLSGASAGSAQAVIVEGTRRHGKTASANFLAALARRDYPDIFLIRLNGAGQTFNYDAPALYRSILKGRCVTGDVPGELETLSNLSDAELPSAFWKKLQDISHKRPVVLVLDEPYTFVTGDRDFFRNWRRLFDAGSNVSLVFLAFIEAIIHALEEARFSGSTGSSSSYSHTLNVARRTALPPFTASDTAKMIAGRLFASQPPEFSAGFTEYVRMIAAANPYIIEGACMMLHGYWQGRWQQAGPHFQPAALFDQRLGIADYDNLMPWLTQAAVNSYTNVMNPLWRSRLFDEEASAALDVKKLLEFAARRFIMSGKLTLPRYRLLHPAEEAVTSIRRNPMFTHFLFDYFHRIGMFTLGLDPDGSETISIDNFPLLAISGARILIGADEPDLARFEEARLFAEHPNKDIQFFETRFGDDGRFHFGQPDIFDLFDKDEPPTITMRISPRQILRFFLSQRRQNST